MSSVFKKMSLKGITSDFPEFNLVTYPIDELSYASKGLGNVSIYPDEDGVYRRMPLFSKVGEYVVPSLVSSYFLKEGYIKSEGKKFIIDKVTIPQVNGAFLLKF